MAHYRIYTLSADNKITAGCDADCADDDAAYSEAARLLANAIGGEIWNGRRYVGAVIVATDC